MKLKEHLSRSLGYRLQNLSSKFKSVDIQKEFGSLVIRNGTSDIRVFKQIFLDEVYFFFPDGFNPKVIIDAGANVGYSAIWFDSKFNNAKIFAIEPERSNFDLLKKNTENRPRVIPIFAGLWFEKSFLKIHDSKAGKWAFETKLPKDGENTDVETVTIPQLVSQFQLNKIDLLKIDIEGAEFELFKNQAEEWLPLVSMLMIETHESLKPGVDNLIDEKLRSSGFTKFLSKELSIFIRL